MPTFSSHYLRFVLRPLPSNQPATADLANANPSHRAAATNPIPIQSDINSPVVNTNQSPAERSVATSIQTDIRPPTAISDVGSNMSVISLAHTEIDPFAFHNLLPSPHSPMSAHPWRQLRKKGKGNSWSRLRIASRLGIYMQSTILNSTRLRRRPSSRRHGRNWIKQTKIDTKP